MYLNNNLNLKKLFADENNKKLFNKMYMLYIYNIYIYNILYIYIYYIIYILYIIYIISTKVKTSNYSAAIKIYLQC